MKRFNVAGTLRVPSAAADEFTETQERPSGIRSRRHTECACYFAPLLCLASLVVGCSSDAVDADRGPSGLSGNAELIEELFDNAIGLLGDLDQFDPGQSLPQIINRLNQWVATKRPIPDWRVSPLVAELDPKLQELKELQTLGELHFDREDGLSLQEAVWLREASRMIVGRELDDLRRGKLLFDWTIRNIPLISPAETKNKVVWPQRPWETMLFGRGTVEDRAWVFILLARQQGLDVVLLAKDSPEARRGDLPAVWLPALVVEKSLYLFDPLFGLPIPFENSDGVATLQQAVGEPKVFDRLALDADHPYRFKREDFEKCVVLVEASPCYLEQRMELLELNLAGADRLVLSSDPGDVIARASVHEQVAPGRLWNLPYQRLAEKHAASREKLAEANRLFGVFRQPTRHLWQARVLHLMGRFTGDDGAIHFYQLARPSNEEIVEALELKHLTPALEANVREAKEDASYWLGLVAYERALYPTAIDYFRERTLAAYPKGRWTAGATYNLGRALEAEGDFAAARAEFEKTTGPQHPGDLIRAERLKNEKPKTKAD